MSKQIWGRVGGDQYYNCTICNKPYTLQSMYACYHGQYLCKKCYIQINCKERKCPHGICVKSEMQSSNVERGEPMERSKLMFPNPCQLTQMVHNLPNDISLLSLATICKPSLLCIPASKRPIYCPYFGCHKTIAVSFLNTHFRHEHKHVGTCQTFLETRNTMEFYFTDLYGKVRAICLTLLDVKDNRGFNEGNEKLANNKLLPVEEEFTRDTQSLITRSMTQSQSLTNAKPFFIVMAAKITANDLSGIDDDEEETFLETGFSPIDRILFYISSNVLTSYSYTLALSTYDQSIRLKYCGPILTLNEDYKKLCEQGKGLIINHNHVDGMSDFGNKPVSVDFVLHSTSGELREDD